MPKRRRTVAADVDEKEKNVVFAARGRLKGALLDALDPISDEGSSDDEGCERKSNHVRRDLNSEMSDGRRGTSKKAGMTPTKSNSYVMKLFDRSVDLAQFNESTPLYPICRAWMANQPRTYGRNKSPEHELSPDRFIGLPPPEGIKVPKVPPLLVEQCVFHKDEINFDYNASSPPSSIHLMELHKTRWASIRRKWQEQSTLYESRYSKAQNILKEMDTSSM